MRILGALVLLAGLAVGAFGLLWSFGKAFGSEWDYCGGADCASGWFIAVPLVALGVVGIVAGVRLLRAASGP